MVLIWHFLLSLVLFFKDEGNGMYIAQLILVVVDP
jgi:hypothetical protein